MIPRPDLLDDASPQGLEVFQLTHESAVRSCHVYMEAQIFTPDSERFLLHRSAHSHGSDQRDPEHRYLLCDVATGGLMPVTDEVGATAPSVSPDGKFFYYFVNETVPGGGRVSLIRRNIDGTAPLCLTVIDGPLPGTSFRPSHIYPLSTISSDGKRLAISCFLGDGVYAGGSFGLLIFNLENGDHWLAMSGPSWCNMHPQYSRSLDPEKSHDIMVQENHAHVCEASGDVSVLCGGLGADIHLIRDDGQHFRNFPWGRDGKEECQGHQCWRGRSDWAIGATGGCSLFESLAVPHVDHDGALAPGAVRNELSRNFATPRFSHFSTDIAGELLITDNGNGSANALYLMELGEPGVDAFRDVRYLLNPRASWTGDVHIHPFLSPDGKTAFFNSDESGVLQAYMVRGLRWVRGRILDEE
jgi:hypothetical protein